MRLRPKSLRRLKGRREVWRFESGVFGFKSFGFSSWVGGMESLLHMRGLQRFKHSNIQACKTWMFESGWGGIRGGEGKGFQTFGFKHSNSYFRMGLGERGRGVFDGYQWMDAKRGETGEGGGRFRGMRERGGVRGLLSSGKQASRGEGEGGFHPD